MAFLLRAIGLGETIPGFPYTPSSGSAAVTVETATVTWTVRHGQCDESKRPVVIFSANLSDMEPRRKELVRHAMKRAKSLLLPGLLRCHGAAEYRDTVYVATEPCRSLASARRGKVEGPCTTPDDDGEDGEEAFNEIVALGLKTIGTALSALHKNKLIHGNVTCESVYVLPTGEWRLFGLELVSGFDDVRSSYLPYCPLLPAYRRPPETLQASYENCGNVSAIDSWGMACLIYEVLGAGDKPADQLSQTCSTEDIRSCRTLPRALRSSFSGLCTVNPKMRHDIDRFIGTSDFIISSDYVQCVQMLDDYSLKDAAERERFMEHLGEVVSTFPRDACKCLVLQKLLASFTFGILPSVVDPVVKIASRITSPDEYATYVAPVVVALFHSTERMVRLRVLQQAAELLPRMPASAIDGDVWNEYVAGFSSPIASIREHSARALVPLAPLLTEKRVVDDVPRLIAQLQQDSEGPIRTNATIALCLIADVIPAEHRSKLFSQRFGRMLKDPFAPSRIAALRSFHTTLKYFTVQDVAELVLPGVSPLVMDKVTEVRVIALDVLHAAVTRLEAHHRELASGTSNDGDNTASVSATGGGAANGSSSANKGADATPSGTRDWGFSSDSGVKPSESRSKWKVKATTSETVKALPVRQEGGGSHSPYSAPEGDDEESWGEEIVMKSQKSNVQGFAARSEESSCGPPEDKRVMKLRKKGIGASRLP